MCGTDILSIVEEKQSTWHIRIIALILGVLIVSAALYFRYAVPQGKTTLQLPDTSATSTDILSIDTDEDSYPDWREVLYGSDPLSASSTPETINRTSLPPSIGSGNATDSFAHALLTQYLGASNNGTQSVLDPAGLGSDIADQVPEIDVEYKTVLVSDLRIVAETPANHASYVSNYDDAVKPLASLSEPEISLYSRFISGDKEAGGALLDTAEIYEQVADTLKKMSVPNEGAAKHLGATNALGYYAATLKAMYSQVDDPVASLLLLRSYNEAEQYMFDSFAQLNLYLALEE